MLTDTSAHDSLFSKLPDKESALVDTSTSRLIVAESSTTEPDQTSTDALAWSSHPKGGGMYALPDALFGPALNHTCELKHPSSTAVTAC